MPDPFESILHASTTFALRYYKPRYGTLQACNYLAFTQQSSDVGTISHFHGDERTYERWLGQRYNAPSKRHTQSCFRPPTGILRKWFSFQTHSKVRCSPTVVVSRVDTQTRSNTRPGAYLDARKEPRMLQNMSSSEDIVTCKGETVWFCSECNDGPISCWVNVCVVCSHQICGYCRVEECY